MAPSLEKWRPGGEPALFVEEAGAVGGGWGNKKADR